MLRKALYLTIFSGFFAHAEEGYSLVKADEFLKLMEKEKALLIDLRTPQEFAGGYIKGAININYYDPNFKEIISSLEKGRTYLVYCHSGGRSRQGAKLMNTLGYSPVYDLRGGISRNRNRFIIE